MRSATHLSLLLAAACNAELGSITGESNDHSGDGGSFGSTQFDPNTGEPTGGSTSTLGTGDLSAETGTVDDSTTTGTPVTTDPTTATTTTTDPSTSTTDPSTSTTDPSTSTTGEMPPLSVCDDVGSPPSKLWHFRDNNNDGGDAEWVLPYGWSVDLEVVGDWDGDGKDTPAVFRKGCWYLVNSFDKSQHDTKFEFGMAGDIPVAGDWNGDAVDTIGYYRNNTFYLRNTNDFGDPEPGLPFGQPGSIPVVGDWDKDGDDTIGVFLDGHWQLTNDNVTIAHDLHHGAAGYLPVVGDWFNTGMDTVGVVDPFADPPYLRWKVKHENNDPAPYYEFGYGAMGDKPLAGDWNKDGFDTSVVTRPDI